MNNNFFNVIGIYVIFVQFPTDVMRVKTSYYLFNHFQPSNIGVFMLNLIVITIMRKPLDGCCFVYVCMYLIENVDVLCVSIYLMPRLNGITSFILIITRYRMRTFEKRISAIR